MRELTLLKKILASTLFICASAVPSWAACGKTATYYNSGTVTASGAPFHPNGNTVAHNSYPFGTRLKIVNQRTGYIAYGVVRDRGGFSSLGVDLDMAQGLFSRIEKLSRGVARVCIYRV